MDESRRNPGNPFGSGMTIPSNREDILGSCIVSAVLTTCGRDTVKRAALSARLQQGVEVQLVVVVDGDEISPDIRTYLESLNAELIFTGGAGAPSARNAGVAAATAPYVAFLDDDDWWEPAKLSRQVLLAEAAKKASGKRFAVASARTRFHERGGRTRVIPRFEWSGETTIESYLVTRRRIKHGDGYVQTSGILVDASLLREVPWDEQAQKHQDWDLLARIFRRSDVAFTTAPEVLVNVTQGSVGSISRTQSWADSYRWLAVHGERLSRRAQADFLFTHLLRAAFATGRATEVVAILSLVRPKALPHVGAIVVAAHALLGGIIFKLRHALSNASEG